MTDDSAALERRRRSTELADELRLAIEALSVRDIAPAALARATERLRAVRADLDGPIRPRWYDHDAVMPAASAGARDAYREQSPIGGSCNPLAPPVRVEIVEAPDGSARAVGLARLSRAYEGPPHGVHGGWVAAMFDELLGAIQGRASAPGVTAKLEITYRHLTPIEEDLRLEAWIESERGRRIVARATCHAGETLTAEAQGLFVRVDFEALQAIMSARRKPNDDGS